MARRARVQLSDILHQLSDDEWAAEGSDDNLGMDDAMTLLAQMKVHVYYSNP